VHGLDLLAYRFAGDAPALAADVVAAVDIPVLAAGSVDRVEQIEALKSANVWGFTVGTAILDGTFRIDAPQRTIEGLLAAVLEATEKA
jgi:phosphoribosylformimino-5-aminoimidazole carboxamide ribonucleotide (ProFAR) isomerase